MIDEKKLISYIENQYRQWGEEYTAEQILGDIEDFPKVGELIPLEERLPKYDGYYLIQAINDYGGIYMAVSNYDSQYKTFCSDGVEDDNAIAWMDLPKMYEVRENERP